MRNRSLCWRLISALALSLLCGFVTISVARAQTEPDKKVTLTYTNPLTSTIPAGGVVDDCPDPSIIQGQTVGDHNWYMYCTEDPLNDNDVNVGQTDFNFHKMTMHMSSDLVHWTYKGDVFSDTNPGPSWAMPNSLYFAPDIRFLNGTYYLYFAATDTIDPVCNGQTPSKSGGSAIGVATSSSPTGPWIPTAAPVVAPRPNGPATDCNFFATIDPALISDEFGQLYIYYGSYYGGIQVRPLASDGTTPTDSAAAVQITIPNRYEAAYVVKHASYYYLFASATNCCAGPVTGYTVFTGRSTSPLGPFVDREGVALTASRVGGTIAISMNGNKWIGPGHNAVFTDANGQDWLLYHAVDQNHPYFTQPANRTASPLTKRPALMDRLDWVNEWPSVRAGAWASATLQLAPATTVSKGKLTVDKPVADDKPGHLLPAFSDDFNTATLASKWSWVRPPSDTSSYGFDNDGTFRFNVQQNVDLSGTSNNASVLIENAPPKGDYMVEARIKLDVPRDGCCHNYVQGDVVIYKDDDNYVRLGQTSIWETRQTEFGKEMTTGTGSLYGNTVVGPPDLWTWVRIVKRTVKGTENYTAYTSRDGSHWIHGGTWTHALGSTAKIGLVAMGQNQDLGTTFHANFDYVHVYTLK